MHNPVARSEGLLVEELDDELIICDMERDVVHGLNGPAAVCWQALDGTKNVRDLAALIYPEIPAEAAIQLVRLALKTLDEKHLLAQGIPAGSINRRDCLKMLRQHGIKAAGVIVGIASVVSPSPSAAQSGGAGIGEDCFEDSECASGCCHGSDGVCCASTMSPGSCDPPPLSGSCVG